MRSIAIHGHFYQPPRDEPWFERVPREPSAAPWHDWNERIERECYRAVTAARLQDGSGRITGIVNLLEWISFNVGPTLLEWLERNAPRTYRSILEADRGARRRTGWGTAIAQPYHHAILPLASPRDRRTEIRWGVADFRRRFGRDPLGMWLPETAVDHDTLDDLAAEGIAFTIVGDHQVEVPPRDGGPGFVRTSRGGRIAVFCYDGPISHDVAFGALLRDAGEWERRLLEAGTPERGGQVAPTEESPSAKDRALGGRDGFPDLHPAGGRPEVAPGPPSREVGSRNADPEARQLVLVATDGETFGHHHRFGEMAVAALLQRLRSRPGVRVEPLAAILERTPPSTELVLRSPSAWSCAHGVERWRSDCGCRMTPGTRQGWRRPLRQGLDELAGALHELYESEAAQLGVDDPWHLRDALGPLVGDDVDHWRQGVDALLPAGAAPESRARLRELLEMERDVLRSFTSCGWFFDDIGGIEGLQVLRYAARALELAGGEARRRLEAALLSRLAEATSNDAGRGTGEDLYRKEVLHDVPAPHRVAAGAEALALADGPEQPLTPGLEAWEVVRGEALEEGRAVAVSHRRTGRTHRVLVRTSLPDPGRMEFRVTEAGGGQTRDLSLADLPEAQQREVASALRRSLVRRWLSGDDHERLLAGDVSVGQLAADRLLVELEALHRAGAETVEAALGTLVALAELAELAEAHVPFDLQTALHRLRVTLDPSAHQLLEPLARLLGFAPTPD